MKQWVIDRTLERARRKLAYVEAQAVLHRQINDIDKKLTMLAEIKALYPTETRYDEQAGVDGAGGTDPAPAGRADL